MQEEVAFTCPFCMEEITMLVDLSVEQQTYIEDCEVCCRPIELSYTCSEGQVKSIQAERS